MSAKDTKIILLIFLPLNEEVNVDKCKQSLKAQIQQYQQQQEELGQTHINGVKHVFIIQNGIEGLKSSPKEFIKKIYEQSTQYYTGKKKDIKNKQRICSRKNP